MNKKLILLLLFMLCIQNLVFCEEDEEISAEIREKVEAFMPTKEWKVIKKGQTIRRGLHTRINLQTGLKEAKLLESAARLSAFGSFKSERHKALLAQKAKGDKTEENTYSPSELKNILKKIKNDAAEGEESDLGRLRKKFKDYEQLKKELGNLNLSVKSDAEILQDIFKKINAVVSNKNLNSEEKSREILYLLENFEYLVHQIDNANEFFKLDGMTLLYKYLNDSSVKIRTQALTVLGSSVQNNPKAQITALESDAIEKVLRLLAVDSDSTVKSRAIYALSSLLRRFPTAQKHFLHIGGLNVFADLLSKSENPKLQLKIIILLYDLLHEQKEAIGNDEMEKDKQYKAVDLKQNLINNDWCLIIHNNIINNALMAAKQHDTVESAVKLIILLKDECLSAFSNKKFQNILEDLYIHYSKLAIEEAENYVDIRYFADTKDLIFQLLSDVKSFKTEL